MAGLSVWATTEEEPMNFTKAEIGENDNGEAVLCMSTEPTCEKNMAEAEEESGQ